MFGRKKKKSIDVDTACDIAECAVDVGLDVADGDLFDFDLDFDADGIIGIILCLIFGMIFFIVKKLFKKKG